jgi:hypothetical protein
MSRRLPHVGRDTLIRRARPLSSTTMAQGAVKAHGRRRERRTVVPAAAVIVFAVMMSACRGEATGPVAAPPAAAAITWREIGSWSGRLSRQTESFEVSTAAMRLRWRTTRETEPGAGRLTVTLHSAVSGRPLQTILEARGLGGATVDVMDEPRWCHFVIEAANVEYEMTLEQGFAATAR